MRKRLIFKENKAFIYKKNSLTRNPFTPQIYTQSL